MEALSRDRRLALATEAFEKGLFASKQACAAAFDVKISTLKGRLRGVKSRSEIEANCRKLSINDELVLKWKILDMDSRGYPLTIAKVRYLAEILLAAKLKPSAPNDIFISARWVNRFISRHEAELESKYTRRYDYQRAKCEDPKTINRWFDLVRNTIQKYGILDQDTYNMDETGFQMGVAATAKVVCGAESRESNARSVQPDNREWVTAIITINAAGIVLPPQIIFAGKMQQERWFKDIPKSYRISMSENGWTNDKLGFEWLQFFDDFTASKTAGQYRLLLLDGHGSHSTPEFDQFCKVKNIIPLYMPPHSSHKLQPLDVGCFSPLKKYYGQQISKAIQNGMEHIDKSDFIRHFKRAYKEAFSTDNIKSSFAATGLVPYSPNRVLSKLKPLRSSTPTPPSTSSSNQSMYLGKTPVNLYQLNHQREELQALQESGLSSLIADQALEKVYKGAEMAMQNAVLLQQEIRQLRAVEQYKKDKKKASRRYLQAGGTLTGQEGQEMANKAAEEARNRAAQGLSTRRPPRCSNFNQEGHNRLRCPS
ncbi:transposase [Aspergillus melleus]|uniref:transposase n=1 Tax=Aspergillus melleus TaxID=138277 RepID=UPI001E8EA825|nr:uncharacterized protein LDX57_013065 [Aspergillus melleus]KAH8430077.1 hypothetical protein LDX57_013065 [Aspergillus melleus]